MSCGSTCSPEANLGRHVRSSSLYKPDPDTITIKPSTCTSSEVLSLQAGACRFIRTSLIDKPMLNTSASDVRHAAFMHAPTSKPWNFSQPIHSENIQMKSVRQASMVHLAAPLRFLVTLMPKKLKNAMDTTLASVLHCSALDALISCEGHRAA